MLAAASLFAAMVQACSAGDPAASSGSAGAAQTVDDDVPPQAATLETATGVAWIVHLDPLFQGGAIDFAAPKEAPAALPSAASPDAAVLAFLAANKSTFGMDDPRSDLVTDEIEPADADTGATHVHFHQVKGTVPVESMTWAASIDKSGKLTELSGEYVPGLASFDVTPEVTSDQAVAAMHATLTAQGTDFDDDDFAAPTTTLVIYALGGTPTLAWSIDQPVATSRLHYEIDAKSGAVIVGYQSVHHERSMTAHGALSFVPYNKSDDLPTIEVSDDGATLNGVTTVFDGTKVGIHTVKGGKGTSAKSCKTSEKVKTSDITNTTADLSAWTDATTPSGEAASAQANAAAVVQYYASQYLWMSYDGKGSTITSIINQNCSTDDGAHYDLDPDNAYWDGEKSMHYGDGDSKGVQPTSASKEIVAHELSHGVTQFTSKLGGDCSTGDTSSSAINEANSDIHAAFFSHLEMGEDDAHAFIIGEDADTQDEPIRDMIHPATDKSLGFGAAPTWATVSAAGKSPECHDASTIVSHAFYLYTHGGVHDTSGRPITCGIGWSASEKLWWQTQRHHMSATEHYNTLAMHQITSAKELNLPLQSIACAWVAVGALTDSWVTKNLSLTCAKAGSDAGAGSSSDGGADGGAGSSLVSGGGALIMCSGTPVVGSTTGLPDAGTGGSLLH
jgi:Zn-dependent metalloprotease